MAFSLALTREILERTPGVVRAMLEGASPAWIDRPYGERTWSARDVVAHLIHGERTDWIPRARIIMEHGDSRPFDPFDRTGYIAEASTQLVPALLDEFEGARARSLAALDGFRLTDADLNRVGTHPALGPVTLRNLLATWAVHDLNHIAQMGKAMAHQYAGDVGPWQAYLSILAPPAPR